MLTSLASSIIGHFIPAAYIPLVTLILAFLVGLEQWLASTKRIKANSTLQLIVGIAQKFVAANPPDSPAKKAVAQAKAPETPSGEATGPEDDKPSA